MAPPGATPPTAPAAAAATFAAAAACAAAAGGVGLSGRCLGSLDIARRVGGTLNETLTLSLE